MSFFGSTSATGSGAFSCGLGGLYFGMPEDMIAATSSDIGRGFFGAAGAETLGVVAPVTVVAAVAEAGGASGVLAAAGAGAGWAGDASWADADATAARRTPARAKRAAG
jgi:hypothetical protein